VAANTGDRSSQFPLIEKRYGHPVSFWLSRLGELDDTRYAAQMSYLQEEHGFTRSHANTVVMYARGSTSTKRFADPDAFFATLTAQQATTARAIFKTIQKRFGDLELVIAWNQPILRRGTKYVMGLAATSQYLLLLPWGDGVLDLAAPHLTGLTVKKKSIQVPSDWKVDTTLLETLVAERIRQIDAGA
jgi:uncharacterized protein YdhG (YjbR/CyaY superfamily)